MKKPYYGTNNDVIITLDKLCRPTEKEEKKFIDKEGFPIPRAKKYIQWVLDNYDNIASQIDVSLFNEANLENTMKYYQHHLIDIRTELFIAELIKRNNPLLSDDKVKKLLNYNSWAVNILF